MNKYQIFCDSKILKDKVILGHIQIEFEDRKIYKISEGSFNTNIIPLSIKKTEQAKELSILNSLNHLYNKIQQLDEKTLFNSRYYIFTNSQSVISKLNNRSITNISNNIKKIKKTVQKINKTPTCVYVEWKEKNNVFDHLKKAINEIKEENLVNS
jgi:predicted DNA-binding protein YlxM (UPF0122 family)